MSETKVVAELPELGNEQVRRENSSKVGEIVRIALNKIVIREGFNVREDMGELEELSKSILNNGQSMPGRVDVAEDGTFILVDGHRRFSALKLLEADGHEPYFLAIVNGKRTTEEQRILQMFTTQDNKPLTAPEVAELILRLVNLGHDQLSVANKIGKTPAYVSQMLGFANETPEIKNLVKEGKVKVSTVFNVKRTIKNQAERTQVIKDAVATNTTGKAVTTEAITGNTEKKINAIANELIAIFGIDAEEIDTIKSIIKRNL
jgi:ParB/RepB/Spo0J family partition protein